MNILVVLARSPLPGVGKSRLRSTFGDATVDRLSRAMVGDVVGWSVPAADAVLVAHSGPPHLIPEGPNPMMLAPQVDGDLGERIEAAISTAFQRGARRAVIVGTDCPTLPDHLVAGCFDGLAHAGSTLVPAADGGWIALGVDRPLAGSLRSVRWSATTTAAETAGALQADGRPPLLLSAWHDIDEAADLHALRWDAAATARAPRTAAVCAGLQSTFA